MFCNRDTIFCISLYVYFMERALSGLSNGILFKSQKSKKIEHLVKNAHERPAQRRFRQYCTMPLLFKTFFACHSALKLSGFTRKYSNRKTFSIEFYLQDFFIFFTNKIGKNIVTLWRNLVFFHSTFLLDQSPILSNAARFVLICRDVACQWVWLGLSRTAMFVLISKIYF